MGVASRHVMITWYRHKKTRYDHLVQTQKDKFITQLYNMGQHWFKKY